MYKIICMLVAVQIAFSWQCQAQPLHDSISKQLQIGVEGFKNRYHSPSIVVAIVHEKEIIFNEPLGYIDVENKIPATDPDLLFLVVFYSFFHFISTVFN